LDITSTVTVLLADAAAVLCSINFEVKLGSNTVRGSFPFATPYSEVPGLTSVVEATVPMMLLLPSSIVALTLTVGEDCVTTGFVRAIVTVHDVPEVVPAPAAVSINSPFHRVHAPVVPSKFDVDVIDIVRLSGVCVPVRPVKVIVEPLAKL
jgi:hypothetical protein